jgi:hypothetical protein
VDLALDLVWVTTLTVLASIPLLVSLWAFLDAARRPAWAWSFADRSQTAWMVAVGLGLLTVVGGLLVSGWYLLRIRPEIVAAESGELGWSS